MVAGLGHALGAEFGAVGGGKHNIDNTEFTQLSQDASRLVAQARSLAELAEELPEHVGQKADQDVGQDAVLFLVPHGS